MNGSLAQALRLRGFIRYTSAMLTTLEGTLDPEGTIRFRETLRLTRPRRVLVTLLDDEAAAADKDDGGLASLRSLLAAPEFQNRPYGAAAELEAFVDQTRNAWDE